MKSVFITGSNRGLGKGFVDFFLNRGFLVLAGVRDLKKASSEIQTHANLKLIKIDLADDRSIAVAALEAAKHTGFLDILINNAGVNKDTATGNHKELVSNLKYLDRKSLHTMFDINTIAPMLVIKNFLSLLTAKPSYIINISSARSSYHDEMRNTNGNYGYRASKTALNMMTFCSLFDLPKNIRTFTVHPGSVNTDMNPTGIDDPLQQAEKIYCITENWRDEFNGRFLRYDRTIYPY